MILKRLKKIDETLSCQDEKGDSTWFVLAKDKNYFYACHDGVMMLSFPGQYNPPCTDSIQYRGKTLEDLFNKLIKAGYINLRTRINPHVNKPYEKNGRNYGFRSALDNRTHLIYKQAMINLCKQHEQPLVLYRRVRVPLTIYEELGNVVINDYCLRGNGFYEKIKYKFDDFKRNMKSKIKNFNYKKRNWMCRNLP